MTVPLLLAFVVFTTVFAVAFAVVVVALVRSGRIGLNRPPDAGGGGGDRAGGQSAETASDQ